MLLVCCGLLHGQSIGDLEYFIDNDPGFGLGTQVSVSNNTDITRTFTANLVGVSDGYHILFVRSKDSEGHWSLTANSPFYKTNLSTGTNVVEMEYFLDSDPGFGNGTSVSILPSSNLNQSFTANLSNLSTGFHTLFIRTKSADGKWSLTANNAFYVDSRDYQTALVRMEYFIDLDPGFGFATAIPIAPTSDISLPIALSLSNLSEGAHILFIRSLDNKGKWSLTARKDFYFCSNIPTASISGNTLICQGNNVTLSASGGQSYIWSTGDSTSSITAYPAADSLFSVQAIDAIGCIDTANFLVQVDVCSSIDPIDTSNKTINIYPNPFTESFSIVSDEKIEQVDVYDITGKLLFSSKRPDKPVFQMEKYSAGTYLVRILSSKGLLMHSVVKSNN